MEVARHVQSIQNRNLIIFFFYNILRKKYYKCFCVPLRCIILRYFTGLQSCSLLLVDIGLLKLVRFGTFNINLVNLLGVHQSFVWLLLNWWKKIKTFGFLTGSGGIDMEHWVEIGNITIYTIVFSKSREQLFRSSGFSRSF